MRPIDPDTDCTDPGPEKEPARRNKSAIPTKEACTPESLWCLRPLLSSILAFDNFLLNTIPIESDLHSLPFACYAYRNIVRAVRRHINANHQSYRDKRDPFIIRCGGTALGRAFNCSTFHKTELEILIRRCITPLP